MRSHACALAMASRKRMLLQLYVLAVLIRMRSDGITHARQLLQPRLATSVELAQRLATGAAGTAETRGGMSEEDERREANGLQLLMRRVLARMAGMAAAEGQTERNPAARHDAPAFGNLEMQRQDEKEARVRALWEEVTGRGLPAGHSSHRPEKQSDRHQVAQATQKRLVPGGPDPLHHRNEPGFDSSP